MAKLGIMSTEDKHWLKLECLRLAMEMWSYEGEDFAVLEYAEEFYDFVVGNND